MVNVWNVSYFISWKSDKFQQFEYPCWKAGNQQVEGPYTKIDASLKVHLLFRRAPVFVHEHLHALSIKVNNT